MKKMGGSFCLILVCYCLFVILISAVAILRTVTYHTQASAIPANWGEAASQAATDCDFLETQAEGKEMASALR